MTKKWMIVKNMDKYLRENLNDSELFIQWLFLVPDDAIDLDYQCIADDPDQFRMVTELYERLLILDNE